MPYVQPQATNLPDNLYTRGAVVSTLPQYYNYIMLAKARREAKQQAVDSYYQDLGKNLTSTGMASNDVPDFMDKVNNWRQFVVQNRQTLANPNNPEYAKAATQAGYLYNDAQQHSSISKDKVKQLADARPLIKPDHPLTDASVMMMHNATLPISQGYQPMDFSQFAYQPDQEKPATVEDLAKYENAVKNGLQMSEGQPSIIVDPQTKSKVITTKSFYEPEALNVISKRAGLLYQTDPKFYKMVNDASDDPNNYAALNEAYKKAYGKELDIQHPEQFATALLLGQTEKTNTQPMAYSPTIVNVAAQQPAPQQSVDNYMSQLLQSGEKRQYKPASTGKWEDRIEIQPSPELSEMFAVKNGTKTYYPDQIQYNPQTAQWSSVFYKINTDGTVAKGDNGRPAIDKDLTKTYSNDAVKVRIADKFLGQKDVKTVMAQPSNNSTQQQPTSSNNQSGYTNITETNKGKIGVKNGKWYDIKTGKPIE